MSEERKDMETTEEVVEEVQEEVKETKSKTKAKKTKKKKEDKKEIDFNKIFKDVFGTVNSLFTDSPSRGMLFVQGVIGLLLLSVFIGGFFGKLIGIVLTFLGIVGVRGLSAKLLAEDEKEDDDNDETEE